MNIMPEFGTVREHEAAFDAAGLPSAHVREEGGRFAPSL